MPDSSSKHVFNRADVVTVWYFYKNKFGEIVYEEEPRPAVITAQLPNLHYRVVKISRSNKTEGLLRVKVNSKEWREMGLYDRSVDSMIYRNEPVEIPEDHIDIKLGTCPPSLFAQI